MVSKTYSVKNVLMQQRFPHKMEKYRPRHLLFTKFRKDFLPELARHHGFLSFHRVARTERAAEITAAGQLDKDDGP